MIESAATLNLSTKEITLVATFRPEVGVQAPLYQEMIKDLVVISSGVTDLPQEGYARLEVVFGNKSKLRPTAKPSTTVVTRSVPKK